MAKSTKDDTVVPVDLVTTAYNMLRDAILTGEFNPGEQLKERDIGNRFDISRTPVREALKRLCSDGLAQSIPRVGVFVRKMTLDDQREAFEFRRSIEAGAAPLAAEKATESEIEELQDIAGRVDRAIAAREWETVYELERVFHERIIEIADNEELRMVASNAQMVFWTCTIFRSGWQELPQLFDANRQFPVPHTEIARSIAERHPGNACQAMWDHLTHSIRLFDQVIEQRLKI